MKKAIYLIIALIGLSAPSCSDSMLDFSPTDSGSGKELLKSASTAITSVNGVYRSMWTAGWSTTANTHQCFGIAAYNLALDCMADDLIMQSPGQRLVLGRPLLQRQEQLHFVGLPVVRRLVRQLQMDRQCKLHHRRRAGNGRNGGRRGLRRRTGLRHPGALLPEPGDVVLPRPLQLPDGRFALERALRTGLHHRHVDRHGGQPRESLRTVYGRIDQDIDRAIELLEKARETTLAENNKSHINLYVALGIKSRACLAEGDWDGAFKAAKRVIDEGGYAVGTKSDLTGGMNSLDKQNVMWGAGIQEADQAGGYAGFFTHMDNKEGAYAKSAPKLISKQLYNRISATDIRRDWWDPSDKESPYVSKKFSFANVASFLGDYIYMRVEEMYFTAAEAALRLDDLKSARELMNTVMAERDPGYSANNRSGTLLGATTTTWTGSFLENILTHRRIELWGEYGRLFDVRRLGQGIDRRTDDGFSEECISMMNRRNVNITKADTYDWVLTIPKAELDANPNINEEDQNP